MKQASLIQALRLRHLEEESASEACPGEIEIAAFVDHGLAPELAAGIRTHLADCRRCRGDVAFLVRMAALTTPEPVSQAESRGGWRWMAAAAAVLAAVVLWQRGWMNDRPAGVPEEARPSQAGELLRGPAPADGSLKMLGLDEGATLSREGLTFRWTEIGGAAVYEIRILSVDGRLIWAATVPGPSVVVPEAVELDPGVYYIRVDAPLDSGRRLSTSHLKFSIAE